MRPSPTTRRGRRSEGARPPRRERRSLLLEHAPRAQDTPLILHPGRQGRRARAVRYAAADVMYTGRAHGMRTARPSSVTACSPSSPSSLPARLPSCTAHPATHTHCISPSPFHLHVIWHRVSDPVIGAPAEHNHISRTQSWLASALFSAGVACRVTRPKMPKGEIKKKEAWKQKPQSEKNPVRVASGKTLAAAKKIAKTDPELAAAMRKSAGNAAKSTWTMKQKKSK